MELRFYGLPLLLVGGAVWLALVEVRYFLAHRAAGNPPWPRLIRRLFGAALLVGIATMFQFAETTLPEQMSPEQAMARLQYWMGTLALVGLAAILALWDVLAELRSLRSYVDRVERDELRNLETRLKEPRS